MDSDRRVGGPNCSSSWIMRRPLENRSFGPLSYHDPADPGRTDEFTLGPDILVAPGPLSAPR
jgi:hypothetical protein